jgi:hypothetical protein
MGPATPVHPDDQTLQSYGSRRLDAASAESVDKHLESCLTCQRRVAAITGHGPPRQHRDAQARAVSQASVQFVALLSGPSTREPFQRSQSPLLVSSLPQGLSDHPDYEVIRELGQGGMGVVYLARNKLMDRLEVLKVVGSHLMDLPEVVERFLCEIRNAAPP